jgi:hypothetical protein
MYDFMVPKQGLENYKNGMLLQKALPELSADKRELIKSAICGSCWDEMFKEPDDPCDDPSINDNLEQT